MSENANENAGGMFKTRCYPTIQRLIAAQGMVEYWQAKGNVKAEQSWLLVSIEQQRRLQDLAGYILKHGVTGPPKEACYKMATMLLGYCR